ncbi:uncharacterized protein [Littorina saxatilis]|uniref:Uncharacterized protein n=1 Tax=Littorina saxatilis TaxID=31220 RepID=A0AAN9BRA1_9CAEN
MAVVNFFCGLFVFGMLCGCCLATATDVDCKNQTSLLQAQENCFSQLGLSLDVDIGQIQNAIQDNPDFVCSNPGAFKSGMSCSLTVARSCLESAGVTTDILPQGDRISAGIDYLCDHSQDLDTECIQQTKPALQQCATSGTVSLLSGNTNTNVTYITCKSFEIAVNCTRDILASCAHQTADILAYYAENYATPAVCGTVLQ